MPASRRHGLPPRVLTHFLVRELLGFLIPIVLAFVVLYLVVDLFERLDILLRNQASLSATIRYFLFKIPLMVTQILPPAVVVSVLLAFGMAGRRNEITALRAGGVSLLQTAVPILGVAALISLGALLWNEIVVPSCTRYFQQVNLVEIRKRERRSLLSENETWYHGERGFYNIDHIDAAKKTLFGVAIYQTDPNFALRNVIHIGQARWEEGRWEFQSASQQNEEPDGTLVSHPLNSQDFQIPERFEDFLEVQREPEELSYLALRQRIRDLQRKGIDASNMFVDLNLKLAIPFASLVLALVAAPLAGRVRRHPSLAAIVGSGAVVGFGYWVLLGLTSSLGQSGSLPAPVAAWSANILYSLLGLALFLRSE